jgi:2-keto-4-pentenoate hydratase
MPAGASAKISDLAIQQLHDYDRHRPGSVFENPGIALTIRDAYALQFEVARLREARGERIAGFKIGCVSPTMQAQLGIQEPVFGHVFETELHRSGVTLEPADYDGLAIEGEFAVRVDEDLNAPSSGFAVIELHNYVVRNPPLTAQELIGNNAIHAGVVLPSKERRVLRSPVELFHEPITVLRNGQIAGTSTGGALPGGPLGSVARLVKHLAQFGKALHRNQIVLTGSPLPLYRTERGDRFEVRSEHFETIVAQVSETV